MTGWPKSIIDVLLIFLSRLLFIQFTSYLFLFRFDFGCDDRRRLGNSDRCLPSGNCFGLAQKVKQFSLTSLVDFSSELFENIWQPWNDRLMFTMSGSNCHKMQTFPVKNIVFHRWYLYHFRKRILRKNSDSAAATQMSSPVPTYGTGLQLPDGEYSTGISSDNLNQTKLSSTILKRKPTRPEYSPFGF